MISSLCGVRLAITLHELIEVSVKMLLPFRLGLLLLAFVCFKLNIDGIVLLQAWSHLSHCTHERVPLLLIRVKLITSLYKNLLIF